MRCYYGSGRSRNKTTHRREGRNTCQRTRVRSEEPTAVLRFGGSYPTHKRLANNRIHNIARGIGAKSRATVDSNSRRRSDRYGVRRAIQHTRLESKRHRDGYRDIATGRFGDSRYATRRIPKTGNRLFRWSQSYRATKQQSTFHRQSGQRTEHRYRKNTVVCGQETIAQRHRDTRFRAIQERYKGQRQNADIEDKRLCSRRYNGFLYAGTHCRTRG